MRMKLLMLIARIGDRDDAVIGLATEARCERATWRWCCCPCGRRCRRPPTPHAHVARWPDAHVARWPDAHVARWPDAHVARWPGRRTAARSLTASWSQVDSRRLPSPRNSPKPHLHQPVAERHRPCPARSLTPPFRRRRRLRPDSLARRPGPLHFPARPQRRRATVRHRPELRSVIEAVRWTDDGRAISLCRTARRLWREGQPIRLWVAQIPAGHTKNALLTRRGAQDQRAGVHVEPKRVRHLAWQEPDPARPKLTAFVADPDRHLSLQHQEGRAPDAAATLSTSRARRRDTRCAPLGAMLFKISGCVR